jgi:small conductance mechanosensitive channel
MNYFFASLSSGLNETGHLLLGWLDDHAINIIVILVGAWIVRRFGTNVIGRILTHTVRTDLYPTKADREKRIRTLNALARAIMRVSVFLVATTLLIGEINPNYTTVLFASAGIFTVALGFGARGLISDFLSGLFITYENQYRVGDIVEISGTMGTVINVTPRTTVLRDFDGNVHHVPNGSIIVATNKTIEFSQLNEDIVVHADTDLSLLEHVINHTGEALAADADFKKKIKEAPHFGGIDGYVGEGIGIKIVGKTSPNDKFEVKSALYTRLIKAFRTHGIKVGSTPTPATPPAATPPPAR